MSSTNYVSFVDEEQIESKSSSQARSGNYYTFLTDLYWYYEHGGFTNIVVFLLTVILSAVFTISFIFLCTTMIRWYLAFEKNIPAEVTLLKLPSRTALIWWGVLGGVVLVASVGACVKPFLTALRMKRYCADVLGLDEEEVSSMPWDVFVRLVAERDARILNYNGTTWQHLVMIITRKSNYMVGLYNQRLMNVSVPWWPSWRSVTMVFEWSFELATRDMWTDLGEVNPDYISGDYAASVAKLRRSFVRTGVLGLVLSPFVLVAMILYAFFTFLDQVRNSPGILFSKTWSTLARWRMRCIDEVECCLNDRLASAYPDARGYMQQFKSPVSITIARFLVFALAVLIAPLAIFSLLAEDVLDVNIWGEPWPRKVIYVFTIIAALLAIARESVPGDDFVPTPQKHMQKVMKHVRLPALPPQRHNGFAVQYEWVRDAHAPFVRNRFAGYFKSKGLIFVTELAAVLTTPFIFMYSMYDEAGEIIQFLRDNTVPMAPGLGTKFIHSGLDSMDAIHTASTSPTAAPNTDGNSTATSSTEDDQLILPIGGSIMRSAGARLGGGISSPLLQSAAKKSDPLDKNALFRNKIQESVLTFKGYYPHWTPSSSASSDLLQHTQYQQYGSTAYRPSPNQMVDPQMAASYAASRRVSSSSGGTTAGAYLRRLSSLASGGANARLSADLDMAGDEDDRVVELDPLLDPRASSSSSRSLQRGDEMV